jgi:translation initiation factor IF-3
VPEVRLIDDEGNQVGVMKTADALSFAQERELDLVEVAPEARPPVARVLDYSKYKYEQAQKQKQARKHQQQITVREIKFRPKIAQHDYDTKKQHVERFLRHKDKVKITIMFRGREVTHPERGTAILDRLSEELAELGVVEQHPMQEGRNMTMLMAPSKAVLAARSDAAAEPAADATAETVAASNDAAPADGAAQANDAAPAAAQADAAAPNAAATATDAAPSNSAASGAAPAATPAESSDDAAQAADVANGAVPAPARDDAQRPGGTAEQTPAARRAEAAVTASPPGGGSQADSSRVA